MSAFPQIQAEGSLDPLLASAAFEACAESLVIVAKGRVLYANRAFARTFGFLNRFELQGRLLSDFLPPECLFNAAAPDPKTGFTSRKPAQETAECVPSPQVEGGHRLFDHQHSRHR
jgi:PAS domain-containing protein